MKLYNNPYLERLIAHLVQTRDCQNCSWQPATNVDPLSRLLRDCLDFGLPTTVTLARAVMEVLGSNLSIADSLPLFPLTPASEEELVHFQLCTEAHEAILPTKRIFVDAKGRGRRMKELSITVGSKANIPLDKINLENLRCALSKEKGIPAFAIKQPAFLLWQAAAKTAYELLQLVDNLTSHETYSAIINTDEILFLTQRGKRDLQLLFSKILREEPSMLFFDFPGRFSLARLAPLFPPRLTGQNSKTTEGLTDCLWDKFLTMNLGSAHNYKAILIHKRVKDLALQLLEYSPEYGLTPSQIFLWPTLFHWQGEGLESTYRNKLLEFVQEVGKPVGIAYPFCGLNVNTPSVLEGMLRLTNQPEGVIL